MDTGGWRQKKNIEISKPISRKTSSHIDVHSLWVPLKDVVCYLSLLEAGRPEDKLECMSIGIYFQMRLSRFSFFLFWLTKSNFSLRSNHD